MVSGTENSRIAFEELAALATGRGSDLFEDDLGRNLGEIRDRLRASRILVLGGAGSIGASTVALLSQFAPSALHVVDQNENSLAELVRDLRSRSEGLEIADFQALPLDFASPLMLRFLGSQRPYQFVLNFAALKHVRSEKDVCSLLQMLDTNLLKPLRCWNWICAMGSAPEYFSVSTDKAADPANLMGASKRLMERVMFSGGMSGSGRVTSARFANVAFSNGSLLESFLRRFEKRQPLVCPRDTYRFFLSLRESGQICALAAIVGLDRHIVIPRLSPATDSRPLNEIAAAFLRSKGLEPMIYDQEPSARASVGRDLLRNRYPLLLTDRDTAGEKQCEIFVGHGEAAVEFGMSRLLAVRPAPAADGLLPGFLDRLELMISDASARVTKGHIVELVARVLPEFHHLESAKTLDQRM